MDAIDGDESDMDLDFGDSVDPKRIAAIADGRKIRESDDAGGGASGSLGAPAPSSGQANGKAQGSSGPLEATGSRPDEASEAVAAVVRRRRRKAPRLTGDLLCGERGVPALMEATRKFVEEEDGKQTAGNELGQLRKALRLYRHWAKDLFPSIALPDFLERCEKLGGSYGVKDIIDHLRYDEPSSSDGSDGEDNEDAAFYFEQIAEHLRKNPHKGFKEDAGRILGL